MPEKHLLTGEIPARILYPTDEARVLLGGMSESKFRRLTKSGVLIARKQGTRVYVHRDDINRYVDALPTGSAA